MRRHGVFNDYKDGHTSLLKSFNEAVIRPAADVASLVWRAPPAAIAAASGGLQQTAVEVGGQQTPVAQPTNLREALAAPLAGAAELAAGVTSGFGGEFAAEAGSFDRIAEADNAATAARARSVGVVGEGEAGYYDVAPVTPENAAARVDAAQDAGIEAPAPAPPPPDVHALARRIDPDTFQQFDALSLERDQARQTITALGIQREASPEALAAQNDINTILGKVHGVEDRLTNAARGRLADAQSRLDTALREDTPAMTEARTNLMDADYAMRDLAEPVSTAYRSAQEMLPAEAVAKPLGTPMLPGEQPTEPIPGEGPEGALPAVAAGEGAAAEVAPPNVVGEKLGEPAAAQEEASAPATSTEAAAAPEGAAAQKLGQARYGNLKAVEGTGDLQTRGLSEHVEAKAIEDGLVDNFGDLPEYRTLSMADQAAQAAKLIDSDYQTAKDVAMGLRQPPKGVLPESVFVGVEKRALAEGDVETLRQLATQSRLNTAATTMGQRIRTLGERDRTSPVGAIQEVQAAREADLARRTDVEAAKKAAVADMKAEIRNASEDREAAEASRSPTVAAGAKPTPWNEFISSITCGE